MRFSIVTVTLNAEKYLEQTLLSVAGQTFTDYEQIVWDGGSDDRTLEIIKRFPHVRLFSGQDSGISDAMNRGARFAGGEYIIHLHADDCLAHDRVLAELDMFLSQRGNPPWVYGQSDIVDHAGSYQRTSQLTPFDARRLRRYNIISHPATVLSRQLFVDSGGFRTDLKYCMDYELWLRLARTHVAIAMPVVVAKFRGHQGSISTRETKGVADEAYRVRNEYVKNIWERFQSYRTWKRRCKKIEMNACVEQ